MTKVEKSIKLLIILIAIIYRGIAFSQEHIQTIHIKVLPGLQYDLPRFQVKPETKVKLVFTNTDDMDHNLLITKPGSREEVVNAALTMGGNGPSKDFIPDIPQVLWAIPITSSEQVKSITFTTPKEEGVYPYVCTYPGHGFVMYGAMYVSSKTQLPDINKDLNIPPNRREIQNPGINNQHNMTAQTMHPIEPKSPYLYRVYIEGASPAAIVVSLTENLSYCWDPGQCRLRFAWEGGFVDNTALWKGHKDAESKIIGNVFYRDKVDFPLRIQNKNTIPNVDYKGYRLINNYPEFHYTVNGLDVFELIKPEENQDGFVRIFRIPKVKSKVWFCFSAKDGIDYKTNVGSLSDESLELDPRQAKEFTITMTEKKEINL